MKRAVLRLLFWVYVPIAILSLLVIPLGAIGLVRNDPFMTVLAMVLGLPWSVLIPWLIDTPSAFVNVILLILALVINGWLLRLASRRPRRSVVLDDDSEEAEVDEDGWEEDDEMPAR